MTAEELRKMSDDQLLEVIDNFNPADEENVSNLQEIVKDNPDIADKFRELCLDNSIKIQSESGISSLIAELKNDGKEPKDLKQLEELIDRFKNRI